MPLPGSPARIDEAFARLARGGRKAFIGFIPAGFPGRGETVCVMEALARSGADVIELGLPFSDSLADGPVIQRAYHAAIAGGVTVKEALDAVGTFRRGHPTPVVLMVCYNLVHTRGLEPFADMAAAAGVDGLLVPDLPFEESGPLRDLLSTRGLCLVGLVAPTTTSGRLRRIVRAATGFVYTIARKGITGVQDELAEGLAERVAAVRRSARCPVVVGFGIKGPGQARQVAALADGVVVGSALVAALSGDGKQCGGDLAGFERLARAIREAIG